MYNKKIQEANSPTVEIVTQSAEASPLPAPTPKPTPEIGGSFVTGKAGYNFLAYLPKGYGKISERLPLILMLHGATMGNSVDNAKNYGPVRYAMQHEDFPFVVVAPASQNGWSVPLLDTLLNALPIPNIDGERIYLTGYSMGAHATWLMALAYPNRFAAIAVASGAGDSYQAAARLKNLPAWIFHGAKDEIVPIDRGLKMIGAMKSAGSEVKYTIFPDQGHSIVEPTYNNPELYQWFLQHRRNSGKAPIERTPMPRVKGKPTATTRESTQH